MEWTPRVQRRVAEMRERDVPWDEIANVFNSLALVPEDATVTANGLRARCAQLGITPRRGTWWTPEMDAVLRTTMGDGGTLRDVAERLGVTRNAAIGRWYRLRSGGKR